MATADQVKALVKAHFEHEDEKFKRNVGNEIVEESDFATLSPLRLVEVIC